VTVQLHWGAASDTGRLRDHNEDSVLADPPIFVVADGMGGHAAGEVASALAVRAFRPLIGRRDLSVADVLASVRAANEAIRRAGEDEPAHAGMGTTLTGVALVRVAGDEHWLAFNVGDSRIYRLAHGRAVQISVDHSEVQELIDAGRLQPEDAERHPHRNVVTRSLGLLAAPEPDIWMFPPTPGERLLICSDGLSREVTDERIGALLEESGDALEAARALVACAVAAGGRDNVSVIVVDARGDDPVWDSDTAPRGELW
jgi:protein phosphatase